MPRSTIWQIDMGDGSWSVACRRCRLALFRGPEREANRIARAHRC
jgi:hypothetical protein